MAGSSLLTLRVPPDFKVRLRQTARRERKSMSAYVIAAVQPTLKDQTAEMRPPTKRECAVLDRLIGCVRHGSLTKDIDRIVYGK